MSMRPYHFKDDPYSDKWKKMSKIERYAWYYNKLNTFVLDTMENRKKIFGYIDTRIFS